MLLLAVVGKLFAARAEPSVEFTGRTQVDWARDLDATDEPVAGFHVRRARLAAKVRVHPLVLAKFDFSLEKPAFADLYLNIGSKKLFFQVGHQKMPLSLSYLESSRFISFAERTYLVAATAQDRTVSGLLKGIFGPLSIEIAGGENTPFDGQRNGTEGYLRVILVPESKLRFGVSGSVGVWKAFEPEFQTSSGREWATLKAPLDGWVMREGVDASLWLAPFRVQLEVMAMEVRGEESLILGGAYLDALWMITGEEQALGKRLEPKNPITSGGPGAFQIGVRLEHVSVRGVVSGDVDAITGGINWYPQKYVRLISDFTHTQYVGAFENFVQLRFQIEG